MGLRDRLQGRARRADSVLVQVDDTTARSELLSAARLRLQKVLGELDELRTVPHSDEETAAIGAAVDERRAEVDRALADLGECYAAVELRALDAADWEAVVAAHPPKAETDYLDWPAALPALLAESCVEEELRDEQVWRDLLGAAHWTSGELDSFKAVLFDLNIRPFEVAPSPKG